MLQAETQSQSLFNILRFVCALLHIDNGGSQCGLIVKFNVKAFSSTNKNDKVCIDHISTFQFYFLCKRNPIQKN